MTERADGGLDSRGAFYGGGHHPSALPGLSGGSYVASASFKDATTILGADLAIIATPYHHRYAFYITRIWAVLDAAESGADGSNYTTFDFRVGDDFATYDSIGSVNTQGNPAAGEPVVKNIRPILSDPGKALFVRPTRTGAGSVNFATARLTAGVDFHAILVA